MKTSQPIGIHASGMVTAVGFNAPASCAAIRCALDGFTETRFTDSQGEWIVGSPIVLEKPWHGFSKLVRMVVPAIQECLDQANGVRPEEIPLILCVAEHARPGRAEGLDDGLFETIQQELGVRFHPLSDVIAEGRAGGALAMLQARTMIYQEGIPYCIIAGVDSFLSAETLSAFEKNRRLLTAENSNGFIPGEAGSAVLVGAPASRALVCWGIGEGQEPVTIESEEPLRGDGLLQAMKAAAAQAGCDGSVLDFRLTDCNGEDYGFKEASLALARALRITRESFEMWHPADCIGEIGAATVPCLLGIALAAELKGYAPGPGILAHVGDDSGKRFALVLRAAQEGIS